VAGDLSGDVQDAVAQPLGFADGVLAVEGQQLHPDEDVVSQQRQLKPRGVPWKEWNGRGPAPVACSSSHRPVEPFARRIVLFVRR